uniref:EGF-like domain-containing protein n=1 Tax=Setaria italica TaxID=4555 RepID=K4AIC2_SETIT
MWRSSALPALLLVAALIAGAAVADDDDDDDHHHHDAGGKSICDEADCGRGTCIERLGWIPWRSSYKCDCDPGWNRAIKMVASSPCNVPECSFNSSCLNLALLLPRGIPFSDPCVAVNCGSGECKKDEGFHYHCECEKGYANMLNNTKFPCIDDSCLMGMHCPALDDPAPPPPAPKVASSSLAPPDMGFRNCKRRKEK